MNAVQLTFGDKVTRQARAGNDGYCYLTLDVENRADTGPARLRFDYEEVASVFFREMLTALDGIATGNPTRLPRPHSIEADREGDSMRYDATHTPIARADGDIVRIAITSDDVNSDRLAAGDWDRYELLTAVEVDVEPFVSAVVSAAEEYVSLVREHRTDDWHDERLLGVFEDGQAIRSHVESHGTIAGYEPDPDSERVQQYLYRAEYDEPSLSRLLIETGVLRREIDRLQNSDGDAVAENYRRLLSHQCEHVRTAVIEVLTEMPDERAKRPLLDLRWEDDPDVVCPALEAAAGIGGAEVREALCETLEFSDQPRIRETAVTELAAFVGEEVTDTLATVAEEDDSQQVREAAQSTLRKRDP